MKSKHGFTIVELLVIIVELLIVIGVLALNTITNAWISVQLWLKAHCRKQADH